MKYVVIKAHKSQFPDPIIVLKGELLHVGEKYNGPENWDHWYFCTTAAKKAGWVPAQVIQWLNDKTGIALEDYSARELNVDNGEIVVGLKIMNGWLWCHTDTRAKSGWVPLAHLQRLSCQAGN